MGRSGQPGDPGGGSPDVADTPDNAANRERAGSSVLAIFSRVLNLRVLRVHAQGPLSSAGLERRLGWAPKASLRLSTLNLREIGALAAQQETPSQGFVTELTPAGEDLLEVADALEGWLEQSPFGPVPLVDTAARGVVRALVAGWDAAIVRWLAAGPHTLAELSAGIQDHSYPTLKRRLSKLRAANLAAPSNGGGRAPAFVATPWLRRAVAPLSTAARWEQRHVPDPEPLARGDVEAKLLLALPLLRLPPDVSGTCTLAAPTGAEDGEGEGSNVAAVSLAVENGEVVSCAPGPGTTPSAWALGTPNAWLDAIVDGYVESLRLGGDEPPLARDVARGINRALFTS